MENVYRILVAVKELPYHKTLYRFYADSENGMFETSDIKLVSAKVKELDKVYGMDSLKIVSLVSADVVLNITEPSEVKAMTKEERDSIYKEIYAEIYGGGDEPGGDSGEGTTRL